MRKVGFISKSAASPRSAMRVAESCTGNRRALKVAIASANASQSTTASSANTVTYRINALGQRVFKVGAGTFAYPARVPFNDKLDSPPTQAQHPLVKWHGFRWVPAPGHRVTGRLNGAIAAPARDLWKSRRGPRKPLRKWRLAPSSTHRVSNGSG